MLLGRVFLPIFHERAIPGYVHYVHGYNGKRLKRAHAAGTTVYIGERYEIDLATGETTPIIRGRASRPRCARAPRCICCILASPEAPPA